MKTLGYLVAAALAVALAGCASGMTQAECQRADWEMLGEREGGYGLQPQIDQYASQCGRHGVQASRALYMKGWRIGISEFSAKGGGPD